MKKFFLAGVMLIASTLAANATVIGGTYSISSNAATSPTVTYILGRPFSFDLTLNVPQTVALATIYENADGNTTITAAFNFTDATVGSTSLTAGDTFGTPGNSAHDSLAWNNSGLLEVTFTDGAIVDITFVADSDYNGNASSYRGLKTMVTLKMVQAPRPTTRAPEPWTMSLFAAGLAALGGMSVLRRKQAAKAA